MLHRKIRSWYTDRWWVGCYIWYNEEGTGQGCSQPRPLLAVPNVTIHPSTASVPFTVLLYRSNGPLLCDFNPPIKDATWRRSKIFICVLDEFGSFYGCIRYSALNTRLTAALIVIRCSVWQCLQPDPYISTSDDCSYRPHPSPFNTSRRHALFLLYMTIKQMKRRSEYGCRGRTNV